MMSSFVIGFIICSFFWFSSFLRNWKGLFRNFVLIVGFPYKKKILFKTTSLTYAIDFIFKLDMEKYNKKRSAANLFKCNIFSPFLLLMWKKNLVKEWLAFPIDHCPSHPNENPGFATESVRGGWIDHEGSHVVVKSCFVPLLRNVSREITKGPMSHKRCFFAEGFDRGPICMCVASVPMHTSRMVLLCETPSKA